MKKYVVFSFDDGLKDFKDHALPILDKYSLKASINIISGFIDKSYQTDYPYLDVNDVKELHKKGFEIANHTDSHLKHGSYNELKTCNSKINEWCKIDTVCGVVMPKYSKPSIDAQKFITEVKPPYISYEAQRVITLSNIFSRLFWKFKTLINKSEETMMIYSAQRKLYKKGKVGLIRRLEVGNVIDPVIIYNAIKSIKKGWCLTLCFHSIVEDINLTTYPKGAYTIQQFEEFCKLLSKDSDICVITQLEACSKK